MQTVKTGTLGELLDEKGPSWVTVCCGACGNALGDYIAAPSPYGIGLWDGALVRHLVREEELPDDLRRSLEEFALKNGELPRGPSTQANAFTTEYHDHGGGRIRWRFRWICGGGHDVCQRSDRLRKLVLEHRPKRKYPLLYAG